MPLEDTPENRAKAEKFADKYEAAIAGLGSTGKYFCPEQRLRWRQQSIRAFMGTSPSFDRELANPDAPPVGFPPRLP
jgi:hypothetical protein